MDDNDPNSTTLLIVSTHRKTGGINTTASSAHTNYQYPTIVYCIVETVTENEVDHEGERIPTPMAKK